MGRKAKETIPMKKRDTSNFSDKILKSNGQDDKLFENLIEENIPIKGFRFPSKEEIDPVFGMAASYNGLKEKVFSKILENFGLIPTGYLNTSAITIDSRKIGQISRRMEFFEKFFNGFQDGTTKEEVMNLLDNWSAHNIYQETGLNPGIFGRSSWFRKLIDENKGELTEEVIKDYIIETYIKELDGHNWKEWIDYSEFDTESIPKHIERFHDKNNALTFRCQFDKYQLKYLSSGKITYKTLFRKNWVDKKNQDSFIEKTVSCKPVFAKKFFNKFKKNWKRLAPCFFLPKQGDINLWTKSPSDKGKRKDDVTELLKSINSKSLDDSSVTLLNFVLFGRPYAYNIVDATDTMHRINKVYKIISTFYSKEKETLAVKKVDTDTYYLFTSALVEILKNNEDYISRKEKEIVFEAVDLTDVKNFIKPNKYSVFEDKKEALKSFKKVINYILTRNGASAVKSSCIEQIKGNINVIKSQIQKLNIAIKTIRSASEDYADMVKNIKNKEGYEDFSATLDADEEYLGKLIDERKELTNKIKEYTSFIESADEKSTKEVFWTSLSEGDKKRIDDIAKFFYEFLEYGKDDLKLADLTNLTKTAQYADGVNRCLMITPEDSDSSANNLKELIKKNKELKTPKEIYKWLEANYHKYYKNDGEGKAELIYKRVLEDSIKLAGKKLRTDAFFKKYAKDGVTPLIILAYNEIYDENSDILQLIKALDKNSGEENLTENEANEEKETLIEETIVKVSNNAEKVCKSKLAEFIRSMGISLNSFKSMSFANIFSILYTRKNIVEIFYSNSLDQFCHDIGVSRNVQYLKQMLHQMTGNLIKLDEGKYDKKDISAEAILGNNRMSASALYLFRIISATPVKDKSFGIEDIKAYFNYKSSLCEKAKEYIEKNDIKDSKKLIKILNKSEDGKTTISGNVNYIFKIEQDEAITLLQNTIEKIKDFLKNFESFFNENKKEGGKPLYNFFYSDSFNDLFDTTYRFEESKRNDSIVKTSPSNLVATDENVGVVFKAILENLARRLGQIVNKEKKYELKRLGNYCEKNNKNQEISEEIKEIMSFKGVEEENLRQVMLDASNGRKKQMITTIVTCYKEIVDGIDKIEKKVKELKEKKSPLLKKYDAKLYDFRQFANVARRYLGTAATMIAALNNIKPIVFKGDGSTDYADPLETNIIFPIIADTGMFFMDNTFNIDKDYFNRIPSDEAIKDTRLFKDYEMAEQLAQMYTGDNRKKQLIKQKELKKNLIETSFKNDVKNFVMSIAALCVNEYNTENTHAAIKNLPQYISDNLKNIKNKTYFDEELEIKGETIIDDMSDWEIEFSPGNLRIGQNEKLENEEISNFAKNVYDISSRTVNNEHNPFFIVTYTFNIQKIKERIRKERESYQKERKRKVRNIDDFDDDLSKALFNAKIEDEKAISKIINEVVNDILSPVYANNLFKETSVNFDIHHDENEDSYNRSKETIGADDKIKEIIARMETEDNLKNSRNVMNGLRNRAVNGFKLHKDFKKMSDKLKEREAEEIEPKTISDSELDRLEQTYQEKETEKKEEKVPEKEKETVFDSLIKKYSK